MRSSIKQTRLVSFFRRLVLCELGMSGDVLGGLVMTSVGLMAVSQTIPAVKDSFQMGGEALKRQAGVLARGSDTGALGGSGQNGGFDIGSALSGIESGLQAAEKAGEQFGQQADKDGKDGKDKDGKDGKNAQGDQGNGNPGQTTP